MKIKVVYALPNFNTAGSGKALLNIALGLDKSKFEAHIVCNSNKGDFFKVVQDSGIPVHVLDYIPPSRPIFTMLKQARKVGAFYRKLGAEVVHSFHYSDNYSEAIAARMGGAKWVFTKKNMSWGGNANRGWKLRSFLANGIVNNVEPRAPRERRRLVRALLHRAELNGLLQESVRYREQLASKGIAISIEPGRHSDEIARADRQWPYSKQVAYLPRALRDASTPLSDEQWTALADFWHYICGHVGEVVSLEPDQRCHYRQRLARLGLTGQASEARVQPSLEVRQQPVVDLWRRISDLVAEVNSSARSFTPRLIEFSVLTPTQQRHIAESESDFWIFLAPTWKNLCDSLKWKHKKLVLDSFSNGLGAVARLRHYFFHHQNTSSTGQRNEEAMKREEDKLEEVHKIFRSSVGTNWPQDTDQWYGAQIALLKQVTKDLENLRHWHPPEKSST